MNPAASASASPASYYEEDVLYEVESIKDMQTLESGQKLFLIKWKNYDDRCENTWEPEENLNCPDLLEQFLAQHAQSRSRKRSPSASKRRRTTTQPAASQPTKRAVAGTLTEKAASEGVSAHESKRVRKEAPTKPASTKKKAPVDKDKQSKGKAQANTFEAASSTQQQQQHSSLSMSPNVQLQTDVIRTNQLESTKNPSLMKGDEPATVQQPNTQLESTKNPSSMKVDESTTIQQSNGQSSTSSLKGNETTTIQQPHSQPSAVKGNETTTTIQQPNSQPSTKHPSSVKGGETATSIQQPNSQPSTRKGDETTTTIQQLNNQSSAKHPASNKGYIKTANETTKSQPISSIEHKLPQKPTAQSSPKPSIYMNPIRPKTPTPPVSPTPQKTQLPSAKPSNLSSSNMPHPQKPSLMPSTPAKRPLSRESSPTPEERIGSIKRPNRSAPPRHANPSFLDELVSKVSNQPIPQASYTRPISTPSGESTRHGSTSPSLKRRTLPSQQSSRPIRDPRLAQQQGQPISSSSGLQMLPPPTDPLSWLGTICRADDTAVEVRLSSITGRCPEKSRIRELLRNAKREYNDNKKLMITAMISLSILKRFYENRVPNLVDIQPQSTSRYRYDKFHKFLKLNSVAGLIQLDKHKEEILAVLPHTADIAELFSLESWSSSNMLLIYLDQMPAQPPPVQKHLDLLQRDQLFQRARKSFDWHLLASALKFPPQLLQRITPFTSVDIYGDSRWAESLRHAHRLYASKSNLARNKEHIILFDRHNDVQFKSKNLLKLKHGPRPPTFWEYGSSDINDERILPPALLFPRYCGGFVTTDIRNMMEDPKIIERIAKAVTTLNRISATGEWSFVLKYDILEQMVNDAKGAASARKIESAMIELAVVPTEYNITFVQDYGEQSSLPNDSSDATIQLMEGLVRSYCTQVENFVLVDDIGSMTNTEFAVIDSCKSSDILEKYSIYPIPSDEQQQ